MLRLLKKRYKYLCKAKFEKAEAIEKELTLIKNEKYEQLIVPNTFFCTFMEGEGKYAALENNKMDFDGIKVTIRECKNPSDIIWLNRGVPRKE